MMAPLLRALLLSTPWQQFRMELDDGEVEPPVWDLAQARKQGAAFFVTSLPDDDPLKPLVVNASTSGAFGTLLAVVGRRARRGVRLSRGRSPGAKAVRAARDPIRTSRTRCDGVSSHA
jgi:hypothetical protein